MEDNQRSLIAWPKLIIIQVWVCERFDKFNPVVNRELYKFTEVGVENIFESCDDSLEWTILISVFVAFEEIMVFPELVLYLTNQEISPLNHHVLGYCSMMRILVLLQII